MLLILFMGCSGQPKQIHPRVHHKDFPKLVKNACVTKNSMDNMHFCFKNGVYDETDPESRNGHIVITLLQPIAFAYFPDDTLEYAIAPISFDGGGMGVFYLILLFAHEKNNALQISYADVLDNSSIDSIRVSQDTVLVDITNHTSENEEGKTLMYIFHDSKLSPIEK
jgi:hypothetical protein